MAAISTQVRLGDDSVLHPALLSALLQTIEKLALKRSDLLLDLINKCRNDRHPLSVDAKKVFQNYVLIDKQDVLFLSVKQVVSNCIEMTESSIKLKNPQTLQLKKVAFLKREG